jgi:sterol 3beta-glucosyltransferase
LKILISTFGTHGDVQPFIAFGKGLHDAGYHVTLFTSETYRSAIEAYGLDYASMSDEMLTLTRALLTGSGSRLALVGQMQSALRASLAEEWQAAQSVKPDMLVYHPKMLASYHIAEKLGIPPVLASPLPFYTPTRAFPNPFLAGLRLGPKVNLLSYGLMGLSSGMFSGMTNRFRVETLQLRPLRRFANLLTARDGTPIPVLYPYSPRLLPVSADFPPHVHVTGYWFLDASAGWRAPAPLEEFLASGPPPVYVGFGSMSGNRKHAQQRTRLVLDALAQARVRGVIARGWGGVAALTPSDLPETVFMVDEAPHDWLFPRMAAVVHHGGAGTTAAGLRAGKPTVICPFLGDQPFWGRVVSERGLGPRPIPQGQLTAPRLAAAIRTAISDRAMRERASALGAEIKAEDGVGQAVAIVNRIAPIHATSRR